MKTPAVISINPGAKTLGAIYEEGVKNDNSFPALVSRITVTPRLKDTLNFLTGISTPQVNGFSSRLLLMRVITSALLIAAAVLMFQSGGDMHVAIPMAVTGCSLVLGFMTRIVATGTLGYFIFLSVNGTMDPATVVIMGFVSIVFAISGPGIYSVDQCLRKTIFRISRRNRIRRYQQRLSPRQMSYN